MGIYLDKASEPMCETFWRDSRFVIQTAFDGLQLKRERRATSLRQYPSVRRIGPESPMMYTSNSVTFLNPIRWYKANLGVFRLLAREGMILHRTEEQMSVNPCIEGGLLLVMIVVPARNIWGRFASRRLTANLHVPSNRRSDSPKTPPSNYYPSLGRI